MLDEIPQVRNKFLNFDILDNNTNGNKRKKESTGLLNGDEESEEDETISKPSCVASSKLFESSDISLSIDDLSMNQSMVKKAFAYYEELDMVASNVKIKR